MIRHVLLAIVLVGCTATVRTAPGPSGPPPSEPPPPSRPPPAQPPPVAQEHSDYLQALSDLRAAHRYLRHRPPGLVMKWDEKIAIQEVENAIKMLTDASINDGRSPDETPPTDTPTWGGRLDRAMQLVLAAQKDVMYAEEHHDPLSTRIQKMILQHIGNAKRYIQMGIDEAKSHHY